MPNLFEYDPDRIVELCSSIVEFHENDPDRHTGIVSQTSPLSTAMMLQINIIATITTPETLIFLKRIFFNQTEVLCGRQ